MADNGAHPTEVDPAAAFLAQQESEIAGIENDAGGFGALEGADGEQTSPPEPTPSNYDGFEDELAAVNGEMYQESNGPTDNYAAIAQVDTLRQEPESLRKWREEQKTRLEALDLASKAAEAEWRDKAKKELEDWHVHQSEQMEKNKVNNRIADKAFYKQPNSDVIGFVASEEDFVAESNGESPGTEWERVARLCDFNPKTNKQAKDVSRMRSVLISLKQTPLVR
ncbi:clathrin light chain B isoform X1 [Gasterosteus aculeatus]|uniref:Clathrin light chain n=1 Tax=Gasterosteus aculeatus aculeatus TaxID=481459 RepID=G3Q309_GASAC|nr:clathrin light chain B isoform X3 [Gasterosteus aculeatus aculeatus]